MVAYVSKSNPDQGQDDRITNHKNCLMSNSKK
jgi:hypothetical protein